MEKQTNGLALASMICGILSIVLSCCCCVGVVPGALAIIFACLSRVEENFTGQARTGLITGSIGLIMSVIAGIMLVVMIALFSGAHGALYWG